jgi:hypothetical protein
MTLEHVTVVLAIFTAASAVGTFWLAWESKQSSYRQIGVQTWLTLEARFDSQEMMQARKKFAQQLKTYAVTKHDKISENVLNFLESVGIAYKEGYLNRKLADSSFSYYAVRYWEASKAYIDREQKIHGEDTTLFEDFKDMATLMRSPDEKIDAEEIELFLVAEIRLD